MEYELLDIPGGMTSITRRSGRDLAASSDVADDEIGIADRNSIADENVNLT